ncbi:MAG TPA: hypothetical protein DIS90_04695 [Cytophagales bacterium]|nr:hypothetical protein [Cytophagales bacterium]
MKRRTGILVVMIMTTLTGLAQVIPVEVVVSDQDYRYQHFFAKELKPSSRFGMFHTHSMYAFHEKEKPTEMMSQVYVSYSITQSLSALAGTFYASVPGFKASGALQYKYIQNDVFVLVAPRIDLWENPSYELFALAEYRPAISRHLSIYSRLQMMTNFTQTTHNRSYQNLRVGLGKKSTQAGFSINYDQYGSEGHAVLSMGIFLRHELGQP